MNNVVQPQKNISSGLKTFISIAASLAVLGCLLLTELHSYLLFHLIVELFTVVVTASIFVVGWNSRKFTDNNFVLFIAIGCVFLCCFQFLHAIAYKGMNVIRGFNIDAPTQLWISTRFLFATTIFFAPFFIKRRFHSFYVFVIYFIFTIAVILSIYYWRIFPTCYIEGQGLTRFKIISEYIISSIMFGAVVVLYFNRNEFDRTVYILLTASLIVSIGTELAFTLYGHVYDTVNMFGHLTMVASFFLLYQAIVVTGLANPYNLLFRNLRISQEQLKQSELKYRSIFESAANLLLLMDHEGNIIDCNNRSMDLLGFPPRNIIGKNFSSLFESTKAANDLPIMQRISGIGYVCDKSYKMRTKLGSEIRVCVYCSSSNYDDPENDRVTCMVEDITEIIRSEEKLTEEKDAAETASRVKSDFLANMSHEIRTPLNAIIGFSEFMMKGFAGELSEKHVGYLNRIFTSGHHLLSLINDILDLSKIESGKMGLYLEEINLHETLEYCLTFFKEKTMTHGISLERDFENAPDRFVVDQRKFKQILINLISNAVKYTPDGGKVGISARMDGDFLSCVVWDTGIGISDDALDKIFLPFERDEKSAVHKIEGTGLGLPLVKQLVELHGGAIDVQSVEGKGSTFRFTIPANLKPNLDV